MENSIVTVAVLVVLALVFGSVLISTLLGCIGLLVSIIRDARKQGEIDVEE